MWDTGDTYEFLVGTASYRFEISCPNYEWIYVLSELKASGGADAAAAAVGPQLVEIKHLMALPQKYKDPKLSLQVLGYEFDRASIAAADPVAIYKIKVTRADGTYDLMKRFKDIAELNDNVRGVRDTFGQRTCRTA